MKFSGQIDEQMSSQSPVVWWNREVNCEVVGMFNYTITFFIRDLDITDTIRRYKILNFGGFWATGKDL
jgi:hypothetical protein